MAWILALALLGAVNCDDVLVLDASTFDDTISKHRVVLVEFFAPWCGHCKQFAPEYAAAAQQLKHLQQIPLATVDATVETKIAEDHGVRGYPTLKLFVDGRSQEYTGGRTAQSIVTWTLKRAGEAVVRLDDVQSVQLFETQHRMAVIGVFTEDTDRDAFRAVATQVEDIMFGFSTSPQVIESYGLSGLRPPGIRIRFPFDQQIADFDGDVHSAAEIRAFVQMHRYPRVVPFEASTVAELFGDGRPILLLFRDSDPRGQVAEAEVSNAALALQRRYLVVVAGSSEPMEQRLMDFLGVEAEEFPTVRMVVNPATALVKYKLEGEVTTSSIQAFVAAFEAQTLSPHLKSEPVPSQHGAVYTLVGSTFDSVVQDSSKDVLVEFYAPWCGHCKKFEPALREVAKKLEHVKTLTIAKMDASANDVAGIDIEGFPTIKLWRADNKEPVDYEGDRESDALITWLERKVSFPFARERHEL